MAMHPICVILGILFSIYILALKWIYIRFHTYNLMFQYVLQFWVSVNLFTVVK